MLSSECESPKLNVYVTYDTDVYEEQFIKQASGSSGCIQPTLILLGLRLGIEHVTSVYWDGLRATLKWPQSVGIAGYVHIAPESITECTNPENYSGRPSASHYFIGVQGSHLFFLDPHCTRPALPYRGPDPAYTKDELDTYHTPRLRRLHIKDMDPSMLIGFLIKDEADWIDWKRRVKSTPGKPVVHIVTGERRSDEGSGWEAALDEVKSLDDSDITED